MDYILKMIHYIFKMMDYTFKMMYFSLKDAPQPRRAGRGPDFIPEDCQFYI